MQVGMFKKSKTGWIQEFFTSLGNSNIICKSIDNTLVPWKNHIKMQAKGQQKIIHPPDVAFRLDSKLICKLKEKLQRTKKNIQYVLFTQTLQKSIGESTQLKASEEEDIGFLQESEGMFCVGLSLTKGGGDDVYRRVKDELRRCFSRNQAIYSQNSKHSELSQISKIMVRQIRIFIFIDENKDGLTIGKFMFYPKVNFPIRKVKIQKSFTSNEVLELIKTPKINFSKDLVFGYISLNISNRGYNFILLDKNDPQFQTNNSPFFGVWAAGFFGNNAQKQAIFWSLIMEYMTDPHIKNRLSLQGHPNTILIFTFDSPSSINQYVIDFPTNARWALSTQIQNTTKIPQQYFFSHQEVIMEEDKQQSQVQSINSKQQKYRQNYDSQESISQSSSARIIQQKDSQIRRLKTQVEFYKNQCEKLQQALNNIKVLQLATNAFSSNISNGFNLHKSHSMPQPAEQIYNASISQPPYFGKKSDYLQKQQDKNSNKKSKQFIVHDFKNMSFAQQNSFQQDHTSNIIDKNQQFKLTTPQFKDISQPKMILKKDIKSFDFKKTQQNKNQINIPFKNDRLKQQRQQQKIKQKYYQISHIRNLQQKYDNYKNFNKNHTNSPKIYQKNIDYEEKQKNQIIQKIPAVQQPKKKQIFEEQPRQRRIKNELYSQSPIKKSGEKQKQPIQQNKGNRSKSPLIPTKKEIPTPKSIVSIQSEDEDEQLSKILKSRKKK